MKRPAAKETTVPKKSRKTTDGKKKEEETEDPEHQEEKEEGENDNEGQEKEAEGEDDQEGQEEEEGGESNQEGQEEEDEGEDNGDGEAEEDEPPRKKPAGKDDPRAKVSTCARVAYESYFLLFQCCGRRSKKLCCPNSVLLLTKICVWCSISMFSTGQGGENPGFWIMTVPKP